MSKKPAKKKGVPTSGPRLQAWLKNPGLRSKLPDSALPAAQLAQRKQNHRDPIDVQAARDVNQQYAPQERLLQGELATSDQQAANVGNWYQNYRDAINASTAAVQQAYQQGQQDIVHIGAGLSQAAGQQGAQADQQMASDAAMRGATVAPQVGQVGQQAAGVRRDLAGSFGALLATQGTAANVAGADRSRIATGQGLQAQLKELQLRRAIQGQQVTLAGEKGTAKLTRADTLREAAHKSQLEDAAFNLNSATKIDPATGKPYAYEASTDNSKRTASTAAAGRKAANQRWGQTVNKYGVTNAAWADWGKSEAGKQKRAEAIRSYKTSGKGAKPNQANANAGLKVAENVKGAKAAALQVITGANPNNKSLAQRRHDARVLLAAGKVDGHKYTHDEINAAMDLLDPQYGGLGGLSPANVKALKTLHVKSNAFPIVKPKNLLPGTNLSAGATGA